MEHQSNSVLDQLQSTKGSSTINESQNIRLVSVRYKIYVLLACVVGYFLWLYVEEAMIYNEWLIQQQSQQQESQNKLQNQISAYGSDAALIKNINQNSGVLLQCINTNIWCDTLDVNLKKNLTLIRSYLQLSSLVNTKMSVDERKVLANINEYLLKNRSDWTNNGVLNSISIGTSKEYLPGIFELPINLVVSFENKDGLLSFVNNIEKYISSNDKITMLYKIDSIGYDVVNYQQQQDVSLTLKAYYYK